MELEALKARCQELETKLAEKTALLDLLFEKHPDGICIMDSKGTFLVNETGAAFTGATAAASNPDEWERQFGFFEEDGKTRVPNEALPLMRAMRGELIKDSHLIITSKDAPQGVLLSCMARPLPGGGGISVFRNITQQRALEEENRRHTEELTRRAAENKELIERLRLALDELSTPVLEVGQEILVLPVIGVVDSQRSMQMSERLLSEVVRVRARHVIVDLTGVEVIDTATADRLVKLAKGVQLLGARCIVSGLQPAVAQTLVELGVEFSGLSTERNLRHALEVCQRERASKATRPQAQR